MSETSSTPAPTAEPARTPWVRLLLLAACTIAVYANSCGGPFIFDDHRAIDQNTTIRSLGKLREVLNPPGLSTVAGRPVLNFSLALNYAVGELNPRGYHIANILIHLAAGLLLFGLVRRTLRAGALGERYAGSADTAGFALALLWLVHPLQTASVTYIIQRAESLMGLLYIGALYAVVRSMDSGRAGAWGAVAFLCTALAAGTKEVAATIPFAVLLFDVVINNATPLACIRKRPALYGTFALAWVISGGLLLTDPRGMNRDRETLSPIPYLLNEARVILHYLRLSFWPHPLVLDYGEQGVSGVRALLPATAALVGLFAATCALLWRRHPAALPLALFFLILAPTSSILPRVDLIFEHRMYLPLACVLVLVVVPAHRLLLRLPPGARQFLGIGLILLPVALLGAGTLMRNHDYRTAVAIFSDTVAKRPNCARAQLNLGQALHDAGRLEEAQGPYLAAIKLDRKYTEAYYNAGLLLLDGNDPKAAVQFLDRAVTLDPKFAAAQNSLGTAYARQGMKEEAAKRFDEALKLNPDDPDTLANIGALALDGGDTKKARESFEHALNLAPNHPGALAGIGTVNAREGNLSDAIHYLTRAVKLNPKNSPAQVNLKLAEEALSKQRQDALKAAAKNRPAPRAPVVKGFP